MKYKFKEELAYKLAPIYNQAVTLQMNLAICGHEHNSVSTDGYEVAVHFYCDTPEEIESVKEYANHILKDKWNITEQHGLIGGPFEYYYIRFSHRYDE